ncbi:MAG: phosphonate ABC transporter, permease protein PhnE, partial [Roseibium sp.]|uniref:PhnE/PtxC family ABC transporter permease n=1 Tax=Roseibium sp. TaxID=1936156 RepID=UPI00260CB68F
MTVDTLHEPVFDRDTVFQNVRRRAWVTVGVPSAILLYLVYTWFAFGVPDLLSKAQPNRALILATDSVAYKVHVTKLLRRDIMEVAIEGERRASYDADSLPDWVDVEGTDATVDLGQGYTVDINGKVMEFTVPDYGTIRVTATHSGVETELPPGPVPEWLSDDPKKFNARPTLDRRVQVTRTKIEVHNYFGGWENFWFPFHSQLYGMPFSQLWALALSDMRIDPSQSNMSLIMHEFLDNPDWQHGEIFNALFETIMMAVLGTLTAAFFGLPLAFLAARNFTPSKILRFGTRRL